MKDLELGRLAQAKASYTTRRVAFDNITTLLTTESAPQRGDLVLARVDLLGQHKHIELAAGRRANLFPGDEIVVCYGNRYAPDQFEAEIPPDLSPCHLVAAGGLAAIVLSQHLRMNPATLITPIGILGDRQGQRINLLDWALPFKSDVGKHPFTVAVLGTSMNSGKSTTAASLIQGLVRSGLKVGAAKVTGTGAGGDIWLMRDAGADPVLDFTDAGFPSTYRAMPQDIEKIFTTLIRHLSMENVDAIVLEVADGLYQEETAALVSSLTFRNAVNGILFATNNALGAAAGVELIQRYQLRVLGISGMVTTSPLAAREAARATGLPVLDREMLSTQAATLMGEFLSESRVVLSI
jgi:hypothetical protein